MQTPPKRLLIELFGAPGVGKTTLANAVAGKVVLVTRPQLSASWNKRSLLTRAIHVARSFADARCAARAVQLAIAAPLRNVESLRRLVRLVAKRNWLASQSGIVLLDQGLMQELWSALYSAGCTNPDQWVLTAFIRSLYRGLDARLVFLAVDADTASARISGRTYGRSRLDGLPESELAGSLARTIDLQDRILHAAKAAGLPVDMLDGSEPAADLVDDLLALVERESECERLEPPHRVSIVGPTGSGKTYLAHILADRWGLPLHELDALRHAGAGDQVSPNFGDAVAAFTQREDWLADGHYRDVRQLIWRRADMIIWLNYPLSVVAQRLVRRFILKRANRGRTSGDESRPRSTPASTATWSHRLGRFARTLRERHEFRRLLRSPDYNAVRIVELTSPEATERWLRNVAADQSRPGPPRSRPRSAQSVG